MFISELLSDANFGLASFTKVLYFMNNYNSIRQIILRIVMETDYTIQAQMHLCLNIPSNFTKIITPNSTSAQNKKLCPILMLNALCHKKTLILQKAYRTILVKLTPVQQQRACQREQTEQTTTMNSYTAIQDQAFIIVACISEIVTFNAFRFTMI